MESVEDYMSSNHIICARSDLICEVSKRMVTSNEDEIVVVDNLQEKHPVGILSEHDITQKCVAQGLNPVNLTVDSCMHPLSQKIGLGMDIEECFNILSHNNLKWAPVINNRDQYCGIITLEDAQSTVINDT